MDQPTELWKPVPGWEGLYEVSDLGRVRSLDRIDSSGRRRRGQLMKTPPSRSGYLVVNLRRDGHSTVRLVHVMVLEAFVGSRPIGMSACHGDADRANASLANLRWDTYSENNRDVVRHGHHNQSDKTHCPQGHPYIDINLKPHDLARGYRRCKACAQARTYASVMKVPFTQDLADSYYLRITNAS